MGKPERYRCRSQPTPLIERLGRAADLHRDRGNRGPPRPILLLVIEDHPRRARTSEKSMFVVLLMVPPPFSRFGASGKPGAFQEAARQASFVRVETEQDKS